MRVDVMVPMRKSQTNSKKRLTSDDIIPNISMMKHTKKKYEAWKNIVKIQTKKGNYMFSGSGKEIIDEYCYFYDIELHEVTSITRPLQMREIRCQSRKHFKKVIQNIVNYQHHFQNFSGELYQRIYDFWGQEEENGEYILYVVQEKIPSIQDYIGDMLKMNAEARGRAFDQLFRELLSSTSKLQKEMLPFVSTGN